MRPQIPAVHRYGGVVVPVHSDRPDKFDEGAAAFRDPALGPRRVVEVVD